MTPLPIDRLLPEIVSLLQRSPNLVIEASPGAGKTTRVPRALLDAGLSGEIMVLEPRRLAARLAARRVAEELNEPVGQTVGYQVRFEERASAKTRIRFVTEGIITRRLLSQPTLAGVSVVILDEFHERHIAGDLALALLRRLQLTERPELRLVVMSATLPSEAISGFLGNAPIIRVEARRFQVTQTHLSMPDERPIEQQVYASLQRLLPLTPKGDVLVFLPGAAEIRRSLRACEGLRAAHDLALLPLHGDLSPEEQDLAVLPGAKRKVIFSTNVAETSVTIEGVTAVIDSGLARIASHAPWSGLPTLRLSKISKASATQRAGRAGRTQDGLCLRLFTQHDFDTRPAYEVPELLRLDLAETALTIAGIEAASQRQADIPWLDAPPEKSWLAARELLQRLSALLPSGALSPLGQRMLRLPLHPRQARLVMEAERLGVRYEGCRLAALLGEQERFSTQGSDPLLTLERLSAGRLQGEEAALRAAVERVTQQLMSALKGAAQPAAPKDQEEALRKALLSGYPDRVGRLKRLPNAAGRERLAGSNLEIVFASGGSATLLGEQPEPLPALVVALDAETRASAKGNITSVRAFSPVEPDWLFELFFDDLKEVEEVRYNPSNERVEATRRLYFGSLLLEESIIKDPPPALVTQAMFTAATSLGVQTIGGESLSRLIARLSFLRKHRPELELPNTDDDALLEVLRRCCEGVRRLDEVRGEALSQELLRGLSNTQQRALQELAPISVTLPGGRKPTIDYEDGVGPSISSRLQDFFGMKQGPSLAGGRAQLVLHLLAPNGRDVQVTSDLAGFWKNHYPAIAKELRRRYPRHSWPDDPFTAEPPIRKG